jgi:hypothetical protein
VTSSQVNSNVTRNHLSNTISSNSRNTTSNTSTNQQSVSRVGDMSSGRSTSIPSTATSSQSSSPPYQSSNNAARDVNRTLVNTTSVDMHQQVISNNHNNVTNIPAKHVVITRSTSPFDEGVVSSLLSEYYYNTICNNDNEYNNQADSNGIQCCTSAPLDSINIGNDNQLSNKSNKTFNDNILLRIIESQAQNQQVFYHYI